MKFFEIRKEGTGIPRIELLKLPSAIRVINCDQLIVMENTISEKRSSGTNTEQGKSASKHFAHEQKNTHNQVIDVYKVSS